MKKKPLTQKEQKFWERYIEYYLDHLKTPTREELARYLKTSPQRIQYYINILRKKGLLKKVVSRERSKNQ